MSKFSTRKWGRKILATVVAGSLALTMPMISTLQPMYVLAGNDGATTTTGTGVYDADKDTLKLEGYNFYTVDKVDFNNKKLPAASKWIRTNGGEVNLATITKSKVVTFAKTLDLDATKTENFLSVTVPSLKTVSKITYVAVPETGKTLIQVTVKEGKEAKTLDTEAALAAVEFRVNNETAWTAYAAVEARLDELGKTGASISVRVKGAGSSDALEKDGIEAQFKESVVRASAAKVFKLAKKAAGPNVTIDYDNHVATLKKGTEYGTATAAADPASYTTVPDAGLSLSLESGAYYGVRTAAKGKKAASNATTVYVPATTTLEAGENISVAVTTGGAILDIMTLATDTYQYMLLTEENYAKIANTTASTYTATEALKDTKTFKWSSLKGKSAEIKKTIKFAKTTPTRLLVRKAGNKKTGVYSTTIVVFTLGDSGWDNGATSLGYGGTTASGDTPAATPSATATISSKDLSKTAYSFPVITITFSNVDASKVRALTTEDFKPGDFVFGDTVNENGAPTASLVNVPDDLDDTIVVNDTTIKLKVKVSKAAQDGDKMTTITVPLPASLGISGNSVEIS